jgi:glycosyltransferase involved in cell wall biosynthesis
MPPSSPTVSVVIPTFNRRDFVAEAVASALNQTVSPQEVIVVDDGSTDGTAELLRDRFGADPRFKLIVQDNAERGAARNRGIEAASGEYVAFLDADDVWASDKLEKQLLLFADEGVGVVHCGVWLMDGQGECDGCFVRQALDGTTQGCLARALMRQNRVSMSTAVVRRDLALRFPFATDACVQGVEDWIFWMRIACATKVGYVEAPLAGYRLHSTNSGIELSLDNYRRYALPVRELSRAFSTKRLVAQGCVDWFVDQLDSLADGTLLERIRVWLVMFSACGPRVALRSMGKLRGSRGEKG